MTHWLSPKSDLKDSVRLACRQVFNLWWKALNEKEGDDDDWGDFDESVANAADESDTRMINNDSNQCNQMKEGWCQLKNCWNVEKQFFVNFIRLNPLKDSARLKDFSFFLKLIHSSRKYFQPNQHQISITATRNPDALLWLICRWGVNCGGCGQGGGLGSFGLGEWINLVGGKIWPLIIIRWTQLHWADCGRERIGYKIEDHPISPQIIRSVFCWVHFLSIWFDLIGCNRPHLVTL